MTLQRQRKIVVILAAPGAGKTEGITRPLVTRYLQANGPDSVRILDPARNFADLGPLVCQWPGRGLTDEWIDDLTACGEGPPAGGWGPGLLVLDDADRYLTAGNVRSWADLWMANRHLGLDVVASAHRPQGIPKEMIAAAQELWLGLQDEPHALDYLARIPQLAPLFADGAHALPTKPGHFLRVLVRERQMFDVDVFAGGKSKRLEQASRLELMRDAGVPVLEADAGDDVDEQLDDQVDADDP